jgi:aminoglycoside 6'-N-acetyltransferase I
MDLMIRRATFEDKPEWFRMRHGLWPDAPDEYLDFDMDELLSSEGDAVLMAFRDGQAVGMIEAKIREYGEGCETAPVGYIEGWYVNDALRGQGIGAALVRAAEDWARTKGCTEMASDTWLENDVSIAAHLKLGYEEAERLVHFVKRL